jgi:ATP-dependent Clp protease ATP-binding subunit ClpX
MGDGQWQDFLACAFCGKRACEVGHMVAGPKCVCICNECILLAMDIISDNTPGDREYRSWTK